MRQLLNCIVLLCGFVLFAGCNTKPGPAPVVQSTTVSPLSEAPQDPNAKTETAILAGGCFWGMQELLRQQPGVLDTSVGYTGGSVEKPDYGDVHTGKSGHAEAVEIVFDPAKLSYERLLLYFFSIHDPTTKDRQGNDVGTQYRSAIFVLSDAQRAVAERVIAKVNAAGDWKAPVTTQVVAASKFNRAERYHQDYLQNNPDGYTCHFARDVSFY